MGLHSKNLEFNKTGKILPCSLNTMYSMESFTVQEEIYSGADATVARGYDNESGRKVVMKQTTATGDQLEREISMLRRIRCPQIVHALAFDSDNGSIVLEYAEGDALVFRVQNEAISEDVMKKTVYQILKALVYIHGMGIIHNDIKPDNILIRDAEYRGDNVILSDFGFACDVDELGLAKEYHGTFEYAPPEKLLGTPYGPEVDIWSLGVTMFVCLFQMMPYRDPETVAEEIVAGLPLLHETSILGDISDDARDLLLQMVQKDPQLRISAWEALNHPWFSDMKGECM